MYLTPEEYNLILLAGVNDVLCKQLAVDNEQDLFEEGIAVEDFVDFVNAVLAAFDPLWRRCKSLLILCSYGCMVNDE